MAKKAAEKYQKSEEELSKFIEDPELHGIIEQFHKLVTERNQTLETAVKLIKYALSAGDEKSLELQGLGAQKKTKTWYDVEFLVNNLTAEQAMLFLTEVIVYNIDVPKLEQLVRQGEVDQNIVSKAYHQEFSTAIMPGMPKPYSLPPLS
jgi:hypothetical protein